MRLASFQITNFRSINDSGSIDSTQITAILGRNDSGKSNLLRALHSLNPADGLVELSPIKDFPRHRRLEACSSDTPVVETRWSLDEAEQATLAEILPRAAGVRHVTAGRGYGTTRWSGLEGLSALSLDVGDIKAKVRKIVPAVKAAAEKVAEASRALLEQEADTFDAAMIMSPDYVKWSDGAVKAMQALRKALAAADAELSDKQEQMLAELEDMARAIANDEPALARARAWVLENLPRFVYVDEYPVLPGRQNIAEYLGRQGWGQLTPEQQSFGKLCKVAGLDPQQLQNLLEKNDQATRNQLANRAGSVVTAEIRRLWNDRPLKVRFSLDGQYLDTLVSDPNGAYEVEVNLEERSRGFQWFFSFYIAFFADTQGGRAEDAILLLDEPGLHLHAHSQADLLAHFEKDFGNQIIYTTHSPFMVPTHRLDAVRTASLDETSGTTVSNTAQGDERTLFPLKAALALSRIAESEPVKVEAAKPAVAVKAEATKPAAAAKTVSAEGAKPAKVAKVADGVAPVAAPAVAPAPVKVEVEKPVVAESAKPVEVEPAPVPAPAPAKPEPAKAAVAQSAKPVDEAPVAAVAPVAAPAEASALMKPEPVKAKAVESVKPAEVAPVVATAIAIAPEPVKPVIAESAKSEETPVSTVAEQAGDELAQAA